MIFISGSAIPGSAVKLLIIVARPATDITQTPEALGASLKFHHVVRRSFALTGGAYANVAGFLAQFV